MDILKSNSEEKFVCPQCGKERLLSKKSKGLDICCYCRNSNSPNRVLKFQKDPLIFEDVGLDYLKENCRVYASDQKVSFICSKCGSTQMHNMGYFRKYTGVGKLLCRKCSFEKTNLEKYGVTQLLSNKDIIAKRKSTMLERYGVEYSAQSKEIRDKQKRTCLKRYGSISSFGDPKVREKVRRTQKAKYGVEYSSQAKEVQEKYKKTCLERYGVDCFLSAKEAIDKRIKTNIEKYGGPAPICSKDVLDKMKATNIARRGVEYSWLDSNVKDKSKKTCLERYGVESYSQTKDFREKASKKWHLYLGSITDEQRLAMRQKASKKLKLTSKFKTASEEERALWRKLASKKYSYNELSFDSSWELAYFIYLIDHDIDFEFQCDPIEYFDLDGTKHLYFPDFKVNDQYIEIKGNHFFTEDGRFINPFDRSKKMDDHCEQKYKCMLENNTRILTGEDMIPYIDYVEKTYGKQFLNECRNS